MLVGLASAEQSAATRTTGGSRTPSSSAAPGITIRDRLRVLLPSDPNNYYKELDIVPTEYRGELGSGPKNRLSSVINFPRPSSFREKGRRGRPSPKARC